MSFCFREFRAPSLYQGIISILLLTIFTPDISGQAEYLERAKSFIYTDLDSVEYYSKIGLDKHKSKDSVSFDFQMTLLDAYLVRQLLENVDSVITIIKDYPVDAIRKVKLLQRRGHHAFYSRDIPAAINFFIESVRLCGKINDAECENTANFNLATVYVEAGDREKAEKCFSKSLNYYLEKKDSVKLGISYLNIGVLNSMNKKYEIAIENLEKSLTYLKNPTQKASALHNLGISNEEMGNTQKAVSYYEKAIQLNKESGRSQHTLSQYYLNLATAYRKLSNYDEALDAVNNAKVYNAQPDSLFNLIRINEELSYINSQKGQYKDAYNFLLNSYATYKEYGQERNKQYADSINTLFEVEKQQLENEKLLVDVQLRNQTISTQRNILLGGGLGLFFITFLAVQLFRQSKKRSQLNVQLKSQKDQIQLLNRELNHRVKNNLAFMTSLLEMQSRRTDSQEAKQALQESETRLRALSLVHAQLFRSDSDIEVNLKLYLNEIIGNLSEIFHTTEKPVRFETDLADYQINAEDAMRMGLIVNELVTNSVKHAFSQVSDPLIEIRTSVDDLGKLTLKYHDNGPGNLSMDNPDVAPGDASLGMKLIWLLKKQLGERYVLAV